MRLQRRSPHWTVRGTRGNKTFQVKTGLSICCLLYHGPLPQEADGKPGTERYGSSFPSHDCFWTSLNLCTWIILKSSVMDVIWLFFSPVYLLHGLLWCKLLLWLEKSLKKKNQQASWQSYGDDRSPGTRCSSQKIVWHVTLQHVVLTVLALEVLLSTKNEHFKQKYCKLFFRDHTPPSTTLKWLHIWFETCSLHLILFYLSNFKVAVVVFCLNVVFFLLFYYSLISQCHICFAGSYLVFCSSCFCVMVVSKQLVGGLGSSPARSWQWLFGSLKTMNMKSTQSSCACNF